MRKGFQGVIILSLQRYSHAPLKAFFSSIRESYREKLTKKTCSEKMMTDLDIDLDKLSFQESGKQRT